MVIIIEPWYKTLMLVGKNEGGMVYMYVWVCAQTLRKTPIATRSPVSAPHS